ncbi:unnamed protein product [Sphagnum troendelagicum]|uniref:Uncharacterized protein n=1 Tax=Sphagnum troendelagicum TaxID=128251 RepID=A0ABP0TI08_9BRYO
MDSQQTERRDGGCCDCASKQSTPAHLPRKMGSNARQSLRFRRVSWPLLARWRRPRSPLAGGGGRGQQRGPHGQTEAAKRADGRSQGQTGACQKGSEPGMEVDRNGQREEAPGTRADGKWEEKKKEGRVLGTQKWAKGTGLD